MYRHVVARGGQSLRGSVRKTLSSARRNNAGGFRSIAGGQRIADRRTGGAFCRVALSTRSMDFMTLRVAEGNLERGWGNYESTNDDDGG